MGSARYIVYCLLSSKERPLDWSRFVRRTPFRLDKQRPKEGRAESGRWASEWRRRKTIDTQMNRFHLTRSLIFSHACPHGPPPITSVTRPVLDTPDT
jgi:hypothetical protein